jgi:hypothetical protein
MFEYTMFSGEILINHNTFNDLCYVAGFFNSIVTYKKPTLNIL